MAKKKKSTSPRRTTKGSKPSSPDAKEAERILTIWRNAAKVGLGRKRFAAAVTAGSEPTFRAKILQRLKRQVFDAKAEKNTKAVAHDTGVVCAIMTEGSEVSEKTHFRNVFSLLRKHPACPRLGGAGTWGGTSSCETRRCRVRNLT